MPAVQALYCQVSCAVESDVHIIGFKPFDIGLGCAVETGPEIIGLDAVISLEINGTVGGELVELVGTDVNGHLLAGNANKILFILVADSELVAVLLHFQIISLSVSAGQSITKGTAIGTTGNTGSSTGSHLHIECLYNGEYYNPLFYFDVGEGTIYGESPGGGGGAPGNAIPPDSYDDATVQALMEEAAKYLGYPYVWGGSSPSTSFDCSGFVCWVFTNSGVHNLPRTTAQGIYDQCTPVSASEAKAGDIIFFTGTYNSAGAVSHVGIYCGNGVMIHCGDPIKYASINTPYWQSHFYSFGRLN